MAETVDQLLASLALSASYEGYHSCGGRYSEANTYKEQSAKLLQKIKDAIQPEIKPTERPVANVLVLSLSEIREELEQYTLEWLSTDKKYLLTHIKAGTLGDAAPNLAKMTTDQMVVWYKDMELAKKHLEKNAPLDLIVVFMGNGLYKTVWEFTSETPEQEIPF